MDVSTDLLIKVLVAASGIIFGAAANKGVLFEVLVGFGFGAALGWSIQEQNREKERANEQKVEEAKEELKQKRTEAMQSLERLMKALEPERQELQVKLAMSRINSVNFAMVMNAGQIGLTDANIKEVFNAILEKDNGASIDVVAVLECAGDNRVTVSALSKRGNMSAFIGSLSDVKEIRRMDEEYAIFTVSRKSLRLGTCGCPICARARPDNVASDLLHAILMAQSHFSELDKKTEDENKQAEDKQELKVESEAKRDKTESDNQATKSEDKVSSEDEPGWAKVEKQT